MNAMLLAVRLGLAAVFVVAGIAKLADRPGSRRAVAGFGIPPALVDPVALLLPLAEIGIAATLIGSSTAWWGAASAFALLGIFVVAMVYSLARGRAPDCHCFGQLHSQPIGWPSIARNVALTTAAALVVWQGRNGVGTSATDWFTALTATERAGVVMGAVALTLLGLQSWLLANLLLQNRELIARLQPAGVSAGATDKVMREESMRMAGLPVGSVAPAFRLLDVDGRIVSLEKLRADGKSVMLIFTDPDCGPCNDLMPDIGRWQTDYAPTIRFALISGGSVDANRAKVVEHGVTPVLLQKSFEVAEAYGVYGTPSAVLIYPTGIVGSPLAGGPEQIRALLDQYVDLLATEAGVELEDEGEVARASRKAASPLAIGAPAPDLAFLDLRGNTIHVNDFIGRHTLLLFWDTDCSFCRQIVSSIEEWEASPPEDSPDLIVILPMASDGNQVVSFRSTVAIDRDSAAMRALHAHGTPAAVLIDANGRIASQPAVGVDAVLEIMARTPASHVRALA